jgi:hypothetical protein
MRCAQARRSAAGRSRRWHATGSTANDHGRYDRRMARAGCRETAAPDRCLPERRGTARARREQPNRPDRRRWAPAASARQAARRAPARRGRRPAGWPGGDADQMRFGRQFGSSRQASWISRSARITTGTNRGQVTTTSILRRRGNAVSRNRPAAAPQPPAFERLPSGEGRYPDRDVARPLQER